MGTARAVCGGAGTSLCSPGPYLFSLPSHMLSAVNKLQSSREREDQDQDRNPVFKCNPFWSHDGTSAHFLYQGGVAADTWLCLMWGLRTEMQAPDSGRHETPSLPTSDHFGNCSLPGT